MNFLKTGYEDKDRDRQKRRIEMETTRKSVITRWTETDRKKRIMMETA